MEGKLNELGIPFMYVGDYLEESPLGKAEWMVALSEVVGKRTEGEQVLEASLSGTMTLKRESPIPCSMLPP